MGWMLRPRDMSPVHQRSPVQMLRKDARDASPLQHIVLQQRPAERQSPRRRSPRGHDSPRQLQVLPPQFQLAEQQHSSPGFGDGSGLHPKVLELAHRFRINEPHTSPRVLHRTLSPRLMHRTVPENNFPVALRVLSPERTARVSSPQPVVRQVSRAAKQMPPQQSPRAGNREMLKAGPLSPRTGNRDVLKVGLSAGTNSTCVVQQTITITNTVHVHSSR